MTYIFFDNDKWFLHDGELPVKPENATATIISQMNYAKAIADIKSKALEIDNPEILGLEFIIRPNEIVFTKWPGSYEKKKVITFGNYSHEVAHLVLPPEGDFKPVYMDQGTVPTERMTPPEEKNMKTEPIAIFNPKEISKPEYTSRAMDALAEVDKELMRAKKLFPSMFINQHEAIAVIREEYLELEQECFKNQLLYFVLLA